MKDILMKIFEALKTIYHNAKKVEAGATVALTEAAAKYHLISGRVQAIESNVAVVAQTISAQAEAVEANAIVVAAVITNVVTDAQTIAADVKAAVESASTKAALPKNGDPA